MRLLNWNPVLAGSYCYAHPQNDKPGYAGCAGDRHCFCLRGLCNRPWEWLLAHGDGASASSLNPQTPDQIYLGTLPTPSPLPPPQNRPSFHAPMESSQVGCHWGESHPQSFNHIHTYEVPAQIRSGFGSYRVSSRAPGIALAAPCTLAQPPRVEQVLSQPTRCNPHPIVATREARQVRPQRAIGRIRTGPRPGHGVDF